MVTVDAESRGQKVKLTPESCNKAEKNATLSSCCGFLGEVTLTDSAVIILFSGILGASDMLAIITTSFLPLFNGLFLIPMAWVSTKVGRRRLILTSCSTASVAYFLAASSPFWGEFSVAVLISMIVLFALCLPGFVAGWFPMLDTFIGSERRTIFFSRMRFAHQITAVSFLFIAGLLIGKEPPIWKLQVVLFLSAIIFTGRAFFINRIPVFESHKDESLGLRTGLIKALGNRPLTAFSIYLFMLNLGAYGAIPLMMLYLKKHLNTPDNVVVIISAVTLGGMLLGYVVSHKIVGWLKVKGALLGIHISYVLINLAFFFIGKGSIGIYIAIGCLLFFYSLVSAIASIVTSSEMMALASKKNKAMAMAVCGSFHCAGTGLSRLITSLVLGSGLLATKWRIGTMEVCQLQTFFLAYAAFIFLAAVFLISVPAVLPARRIIDDRESPSYEEGSVKGQMVDCFKDLT